MEQDRLCRLMAPVRSRNVTWGHRSAELVRWTFPALVRMEKGRSRMQDVLMLLYTVIFFAVAFLYVKACQKLR
jgi:hypothetical protein